MNGDNFETLGKPTGPARANSFPWKWVALIGNRRVAGADTEAGLRRVVEDDNWAWVDVAVCEGDELRKLPGDDGTAEPPKPPPMPASQMSAAALESGAATESPAMTIGEEVAARMVPEPQNDDQPGRVAVMPIDGKGSWVAFTRASLKYALHTRQRLREMIADAINAYADRDAPNPTQARSPIGELVRNFRMPPQPEPGPVKGGWDFESPKPQLAPLDILAGQAMAAFIGREALQIAHFSDEQADQLAAASYRMARAMARHSAICNRSPVDAFSDEKGMDGFPAPQNAANSP